MVEHFFSQCQHDIEQHGGILTTLFMAGVAGSFTHCAGMCGPFVMAQTTARLDRVSAANMSEWHRLSGAALLPYHFGRITTYISLGVLVSVLTQSIVMTTGFKAFNALLLVAAGLLFLAMVAGNSKFTDLRVQLPFIGQIQSFFSTKARAFLSQPTGVNGYIAGILLGFLPCGLLYSALLIASTAGPMTAATGMMLFGMGTIPMLFMVAYGTAQAGRKFRAAVNKTGRIFMLVNGMLLLALAVQKLM